MSDDPLTDSEIIDLFVRAKKDPSASFDAETVLRLVSTIAHTRPVRGAMPLAPGQWTLVTGKITI